MSTSASRPLRRFRVISGPGALHRLVTFLREALVLEVRRPEARAMAILAVEEAAADILEHGYSGEAGRPLIVTVTTGSEEAFAVTLSDRAPRVDPSESAEEDLSSPERREAPRGRGMGMMRVLTRSLEHRARPGGGNVLTLAFDAGHLSRLAEEKLRETP